MSHDKLALSKKWNIPWGKSDRFERKAVFTLDGTPREIFPLLCPVLEYAWLPGWKCRMVHSSSGVAENNCLFTTNEAMGRKALWTCITYEPDSFIEYLITSGRDVAIRLSIRLKETTRNRTEVDWRMLFTGCSWLGRTMINKMFSERNFKKMLEDREPQLNWYLKHKTMIGKP